MCNDAGLPLLRLLQLVSPSLPIGSYTYSQGIEWAVEAGWVRNARDLDDWLGDQLQSTLARLDLPVLLRLCEAVAAVDPGRLRFWSDLLLAYRETQELRAEELRRGRALADLLAALGLAGAEAWHGALARSYAAGFAFAAVGWRIGLEDAARGYAWAWLEGQVLAAVKLVPLGQTDGQRALEHLGARIPAAVAGARALTDDDIGAGSPALAIASARHETQYTRLFRS